MCFSATASFIASAATGTVGVAALHTTKSRRYIPLASVPILFALQQAAEGVIWLSPASAPAQELLVYLYTFFSHILWPIFVPFAILAIAKTSRQRAYAKILLATGIGIGAYFLYYILTYPVTVQSINESIQYQYGYPPSLYALFFYTAATVFPWFITRNTILTLIGTLILIALPVSYYFYEETFLSVWCFFATSISILVYLFLRKQ